MDIIGEFVARIFSEVRPLTDWALGNWYLTGAILVALIYWAGYQRRVHR
jgi:hypothetical protein